MKTPGPDHPMTIAYEPAHTQVLHGGHIIADSKGALTLREADYPPVIYVPREDVAMDYLSRSAHITHCPYKGEASYFTITRDGEIDENAVWSYEAPYPAATAIKDYLAFYPDRVEIQRFPLPAGEDVAQVVEHTDSGAGRSQLDPWPPNLGEPRPLA